ncbi:MAG: alpha/beta hydrolase-fold protein [Candidatus Eisenbacteria bacterium]
MEKKSSTWFSERVNREVTTVRWGFYGKPVLIFPTAGGDAEEIERFHVLSVLEDLINDGKIKVYSCDSVAGKVLLTREGSHTHQCRMIRLFQEFVYHEVVPAIRMDCQSPDVELIVSGASIGAFNSLAMISRYPDAFSHALCLSGTYDIERFLEARGTQDFYSASPVHWMPDAPDDASLARLKERFVLFVSGEGRAEDIGESWRAAQILGSRGVPNRVISWGTEWPHDWPTWRKMWPQYLEELTK